jgi:hypothetical protein
MIRNLFTTRTTVNKILRPQALGILFHQTVQNRTFTTATPPHLIKQFENTYVYSNGDKFVASKSIGNDCLEGVFHYVNGDKYEGQVKNGKKHGTGTLQHAGTERCPEGKIIKGTFINDELVPTNVSIYIPKYRPYSSTYEVKFEGDIIKPQYSRYKGTVFIDGDDYYAGCKFEGELDWNFQPDGRAKGFFTNGDEYEGYWDHGAQHGFGVYTYADGRQWIGASWEGEMNSNPFPLETFDQLVIWLTNLKKYKGVYWFIDNSRNTDFYYTGPATCKFSTGTNLNVNMVDDLAEGVGVFYFTDDSTCEAEFKKGKMVWGKWYTKDGQYIKQEFDHCLKLVMEKYPQRFYKK